MKALVELIYLLSVILFVAGLRYLNSPATARRGNLLASVGMALAIAATLAGKGISHLWIILAGLLAGSIIGAVAARKVKMTAMPQMVGLLNGLGGGASALVATGEFVRLSPSIPLDTVVTIILSLLIGGVTFTGSLVAFGKLQGLVKGTPTVLPLHRAVTILLSIAFLLLSFSLHISPLAVFTTMAIISLILGVLLVIPIGGADMPVAISLLNSFSGLAASGAGFVLKNNMLIVAGALVGAAGMILTFIMCRAMGRSLLHVLFGAFGGKEELAEEAGERRVRSIDVEEAAMILAYARSVIIVPGYGMAVAQAHHAVRELADELEARGVEVKFAIHPVAGRMPGHMNVLLAEANVPYSKLYDMDDINPEFERTDVALVIGASDIVNPAARHKKGSPIYGMPILEVDRARQVIVIKRSLSPGFSGVENELFYNPKTMMLFGGARDVVQELIKEVKRLD